MPAELYLNNTCKEVLSALLDKSKTQSIRDGPPRFKVGDKVALYWDKHNKASYFCINCVKGIPSDKVDKINDYPYRGSCCVDENGSYKFFPKLLGTVTITEVFEIEMEKSGKQFLVNIENPVGKIHKLGERFVGPFNPVRIAEEMPKADGFKSAEDFFAYFDKNYNLSQPCRFCVYRWEWISE